MRELERWARYWNEEPWGAYRDNLHAGLIISELLRPHLPEGANVKIEGFLLRPKEDIDALAKAKLVASLSAMASTAERKRRRRKP